MEVNEILFQDTHGKAECGCEWIHGTVVDMCEFHLEDMNKHATNFTD